jgi:tetratricopeptide (TPR) repeat protein
LLGLIAMQEGRHAEAGSLISRVLTLTPDAAPAHANLGLVHQAMGHLDAAIESFRRAAAVAPKSAPIVLLLAHALLRTQQWAEAARAYEQAIAAGAAGYEAHFPFGQALKYSGQYAAAAVQFSRTLALKPNDPAATAELGEVKLALGEYTDAIAVLRRAAALSPASAQIANNLGCALKEAHLYSEAETVLSHAISLMPQLTDAWLNRGGVKQMQDRVDEAIKDYQKALTLGGKNGSVLFNMANAYDLKGDHEKAIKLYGRAIAAQPDFADAKLNKALLHLALGQYREGWADYEGRWACPDFAGRRRPFTQPQWNGRRDLAGKLLVWGEQGMGDELLYGTMVPDLIAAGMDIVWEMDPRLIPLVQRSWPSIWAVPRQFPQDALTASPDVKAQSAGASLGQYLRRDRAAFPKSRRAYLQADKDRAAARRAQLMAGAAPGERLVGISWISKNTTIGEHKTLSLAAWEPVLRTPGIRFVDVQYGDTAAERAAVSSATGVEIHHVPDLDLYNDIDGLAALIAACDLVITVSNTTTHLAAALGVPTWVLVPAHGGKLWYWGQRAKRTPWYPTVSIFRQQVQGQWQSVIADVAANLTARE